MPARFCVLASGSAGNCAFVQADGYGVLIDAGLGPRFIASRLATVGAAWRDVHAVVLTHTHSDHHPCSYCDTDYDSYSIYCTTHLFSYFRSRCAPASDSSRSWRGRLCIQRSNLWFKNAQSH